MCDCIKQLENKILEMHPEYDQCELMNKFLIPANRFMGEMELRKITPGKRDKVKKVNISFSYCPSCGEKYPPIND